MGATVTSKAATIALLLSATVLSTFCDHNAADKRERPVAQPIVVPVRELNELMRQFGIPVVFRSTQSGPQDPSVNPDRDGIEVCYVPGSGRARSKN